MGRIARAVPMQAFDHVAKLLVESGGNELIARSEAAALVERLRKDGQGTLALAAQGIFELIDARDAGVNARVTDYDLTQERPYVEAELLNRHDIDQNGFARDEIDDMSRLGRALVELGELLRMEELPSRVPHSTPVRGLWHVATLIRAAADQDLITSQGDADGLVDRLYQEGRGSEALAVRYFFNFVDHRDDEAGARITDSDLARAVDYAIMSLLEPKDRDANGYSAEEVATFSTTAKAFLLIGKMIEAGIVSSTMPLDGKGIQKTLSGMLGDLEFDQWGSEGGQPVRAVFRPGHYEEVDEASFRTAFGISAREISVISRFTSEDLRAFIETNSESWTRGGMAPDLETKADVLAACAILRGLKDLTAFVTGESLSPTPATYIVGLAPDGSLVGIRTSVVWT